MASNFTAVNPKHQGGTSPMGNPLTVDYDAVDSKTWKRGEFMHLASGLVQPNTTTTGAKVVTHQACRDQDSATSSSTVPVKSIELGARFEMYVTNNGTDAAIGAANIGTRYGVYTKSNVTYLDVNDTAGQFLVVKIASDYEPTMNAVADTPGKCIVEFREILDTNT